MAYDSLAEEAASVYQCISSLVNLNRMYQFSLNYFIDLFATVLNKNDKSEDLAVRIEKVKKNLKIIVFNNISRSLFQKDRLAFALMLTFRLEKFPAYIPKFLFAPHKVLV
jgi:dynein heavy chain